MDYLLHLLVLICIYTMLSQSLSLTAGFGNLVSLSHAGFFGLGAYTAAILSVNFQQPMTVVLPIAMLLCGMAAVVISSIAFRSVDDYFVICTLGIQSILFAVFNNWISLTNGPMGISGIPPLTIFGLEMGTNWRIFIVAIIAASFVYFVVHLLTVTSFGRTLKSLGEDEVFTSSLGKNIYLTKLFAFAVSGILAAIPGVIYAYYYSHIDPSSFSVNESIFILSIVIIAGMSNLEGCIVASALLVLLPELLRFVGLPESIAANIRQIIYGGAMIICIIKHTAKHY